MAEYIFCFKNLIEDSNLKNSEKLLIAVSPQPYDYSQFYEMCELYQGRVLMLNCKFDDGIVGVGSIARERRRGFFSTWSNVYHLQPLENGALLYLYNHGWILFKSYPDGYRQVQTFTSKPTDDQILEII